jgi:hypothetical protein
MLSLRQEFELHASSSVCQMHQQSACQIRHTLILTPDFPLKIPRGEVQGEEGTPAAEGATDPKPGGG